MRWEDALVSEPRVVFSVSRCEVAGLRLSESCGCPVEPAWFLIPPPFAAVLLRRGAA